MSQRACTVLSIDFYACPDLRVHSAVPRSVPGAVYKAVASHDRPYSGPVQDRRSQQRGSHARGCMLPHHRRRLNRRVSLDSRQAPVHHTTRGRPQVRARYTIIAPTNTRKHRAVLQRIGPQRETSRCAFTGFCLCNDSCAEYLCGCALRFFAHPLKRCCRHANSRHNVILELLRLLSLHWRYAHV